MGKVCFNYLIIVCARAEERSPKTFPGVGMTFSWIFEDPCREEDLPYDSILDRFRAVRDQTGVEVEGPAGAPRGGSEKAPREARARAPGSLRARDRRFRRRRREARPLYP